MTDVAFFGETATSTVVISSVLFDTVGDIQGGEGGGGSARSGGGDMRLVFEVHCVREKEGKEVVRGGEIKVREARGWIVRERGLVREGAGDWSCFRALVFCLKYKKWEERGLVKFNDGISLHWRVKNVFLLFVSDYGRFFMGNKICCPILILRFL
jgi:hypothetical protein